MTMGWLSRLTGSSKKEIPSDIWKKCTKCSEVIVLKDLTKNLFLCPKCDFHLRMPVWDRIALLTDDNSFVEMDSTIESTDPLSFFDSVSYAERLKKTVDTCDTYEAVICGEARLDGRSFMLGVMNFDFMGGSMGSVVGEKLARMIERGLKERTPVVIVSSSGGARMQEGILSLMQMAKTSQAVARLHEAGIPYISILIDPTTGGVSASFAMLGDVHIAEPEALIGFAGPRVIEQTIRQKLPEDFQRAKFLVDHGMVDMIVHRRQLKSVVSKLFTFFLD
ncbi:MAG: acetyl-CoA carboxylase carboxyltransferase subunit beta [Candidatus Riflebacteria bacterium]|nr:acetyl-CoA carboxylase carboxyltransferase subunit beta [Candidatus Riflebacteria bacterium]